MRNRLEKSGSIASAASLSLLLALMIGMAAPLLGSTQGFSVPDDVALRIRLDDTLNSNESRVGDPQISTNVITGTLNKSITAQR